jgi:hypothetical protein
MVLGLDRETVLYAVGVLLGIAAAAYFGFQLFDQVSPVTTALVLFAGFLCFLAVGVGVDAERIDVVAYALAAGCYLVFVGYALSRFEVGDGGTFLLLAVSSGLFIGLGYLAQKGRLALERRQAALVVVAVTVVAVGVVGVDLVGAQPTTSAEFEESIEIPDDPERVTVGTVTVENEFFLPREADVQRYGACITGTEFRSAPLEYEPRAGSPLLGGGESRSYELVLRGLVFYHENGSRRAPFENRETIPVETATACPESSDEVTLVVLSEPARPRYD